MIDVTGRHPGTQQLARWLCADEVPDETGSTLVAVRCEELAVEIIDHLPDGPELTAGLRKLLEARDCFVRAAAGEPGQWR